ncbi:zinc ribbon domain-containing protein [Marinicrinis sediminis]|uniref:Zinc ribbon domain-containing protein n=1 Tax=Marinicrinis sediminis TaxID=1652465 RepID=A0ABW5RA18_9BACL
MEQSICQSCTMPMEDQTKWGTEKNGEKSQSYCLYCYDEGQFRVPEQTMEEMIEICIPYMKESGWEEEKARAMMKGILPSLKRWSTS